VSASFDDYWNSPNAVPVERFEGRRPRPGELEKLVEDARDYREEAQDAPYIQSLRDERKRAETLLSQPPTMRIENVRLLVDDPSKVGTRSRACVLPTCSPVSTGRCEGPGRNFSSSLPTSCPASAAPRASSRRPTRRARRGADQLAGATDVAAVHTGYARYRRDLLRGGVDLYEMKRKAGSETGRSQISVTGSSGASLHTKAMIIDGRWVFVGSMNIDPRSANLNTEMGVLVESPELAAQLRDQFDHIIGPEMSYRVVLEESEGLVWYDGSRARSGASSASPMPAPDDASP